MKRAGFFLALSLAAVLSVRGEDSASLSVGGARFRGNEGNMKGFTQVPAFEGVSLEDLLLSGRRGEVRWDARAFLRWTGDGRVEARWEVPASWRFRLDVSHGVTDEPGGPTNFSPDVPAFFGRHPLYRSLEEAPRRALWRGEVRLDRALGNEGAFTGFLRFLEEGGTARALRGGSYGSAVDFSLPVKERPTASVWEAGGDAAWRRGSLLLEADLRGGSSDGGRRQEVFQIEGFALDRTLYDLSEQRVDYAGGTFRLRWRPGSDRWEVAAGLSARSATNEPASSLRVEDRNFPGAAWEGEGIRSEARAWTLFASARYRPVPSLLLGYGGSLGEEEVDSEGYDGLGPFLPAPPVTVREDVWTHEEGLTMAWQPSRRLSLTGGTVLGWRRYDRDRGGLLERDRQERADSRLRLRWRPVKAFEVRLSGRDLKRDAEGDLGDRLLKTRTGAVEALFRPASGVELRGALSKNVFTADLRYDEPGRSRGRVEETKSGLSASWVLKGGLLLFLQGEHRRLEATFRGLVPLSPEAFFAGPSYDERTTTVQAGAAVPLGSRWHATAFAGQTILAGTEAYRFPVVSASVDFDWKPNLSLSLRGQASGFHRYAYSLDNGSVDFVSAVLSWKF